jgi:hypothetical protein
VSEQNAVDVEAFAERLPDGWAFDQRDPHHVVADNRDTDDSLFARVFVEIEHPDHGRYNPKYFAGVFEEHPLPNVGPGDELAEFDSVEDAVDAALSFARGGDD